MCGNSVLLEPLEGNFNVNKSNGPLTLGFIGGGLSSAIGPSHYAACEMDGLWRVVAGCFAEDEPANKETADAWHIENDRVYANWRDMLEKEKDSLDAVCILTPTPTHAEIIGGVMEYGAPIVCEKSITMDVAETERLRRTFDPKAQFFAAVFNYTGYPLVRELRERIVQGEFGRIRQIHVEMPQEGFIRPPDIAGKAAPPQSWRLNDGRIPMICLDLGVHMHNMVTFLTGEEPSETFADFTSYSQHNVVDYIYMLLRFASGMKGSLWMTKTALGNRNGFAVRVFGEKASAYWRQVEPEVLTISRLDGQTEIIDRGGKCLVAGQGRYNRMKAGHPSGFIEAFANYYADVALALQEYRRTGAWETPYVYGFDDAAKGLKLFEAAVQSNETQGWVKTGL